MTRLVEYPAGHWHPLSLLRFVEGQPLDWRSSEALRIAGNTLGTLHRVLLEDGSLELPDQLFCYLVDDNAGGSQPDIQPIVAHAVAAARSFEAECPVTYGPIYGDALQIRVDPRDGSIGLIDWGTVSRGPLLFDLALAVHAAQRAGHVDLAELFAPYLALAPVRPAELDGLRYYEALMWARSARYFGYRLKHQIVLGDPRPTANAESLARALDALKRSIDGV